MLWAAASRDGLNFYEPQDFFFLLYCVLEGVIDGAVNLFFIRLFVYFLLHIWYYFCRWLKMALLIIFCLLVFILCLFIIIRFQLYIIDSEMAL